jgi:exopolysaccharide production protein ExoQ
MSLLTPAIPHTAGEPIRTTASPPMWHMVLSWFMLVPFLFLSANGTLVPQSGDPAFGATGESPSTSLSHMIGTAVVTLICGALIVSRLSLVLSACRRMKLLLTLPLLAIVSTAWSVQPRKSIVSGIVLLVFTVFAIYVGTKFNLQRQFELIMLVGAVALPVSIALALFVPTIGSSPLGWRGIFGHKQNCATVCMLWLITALHWRCSGIYQKIFRLMIILMCLAMIVMSLSRTGWALTLIALCLSAALWVMQKMPPKESLLITLLALPCVGGLAFLVARYSAQITTSVGKDPTLNERTVIWAAVWKAISKHPALGYGFAAFWNGLFGASQSVVLSSGWALAQSQNGYLDVWLGVGAVGVGLVALMVVQAAKNAVLDFHAKGSESYVRWCIVMIVSTLLYNVGESSLGLLHMVWFLFLLACVGLNEVARKRELSAP